MGAETDFESEIPDGEKLSLSLPEFEGPLDLLLHLVKKHELSIVDIPIAFITDQYLKTLDVMRALNLDVAGEYLLMAATLAYLKSRELVPPDPAELQQEVDEEDEDGLDPRQELIRRLLEYQKYKEAAGQLGDRPVMGRNVWGRGAPAEDIAGMHALPNQAPLAEIPVFHLIEALEKVLSRAKITMAHDVVVDRVSISDRINEIVDRLEREGTFTFESCFDGVEGETTIAGVKHQVVVTFLAILELTRIKLVRITQTEETGQIYISSASSDLKGQMADAKLPTEGEYK